MAALRLAGVLVLLVLVAPTTHAREGEGRFEIEGALALPEGANATAEALVFAWDAEGAPQVRIDASSLEVVRTGRREVVQDTPVGPVVLSSGAIDERASHGASTVTLVADGPVRLAIQAGASRIELGATTMRAVEVAHVLAAAEGHDFERCNREDCIEARGAYEAIARASASIEGDAVLLVHGARVVVQEGATTREYASGATANSTPGGAAEEAWVLVKMAGARGEIAAVEPATWLARAPRIEAARATLERATGALDVGTQRYRAHGEAVETRGALRIVPDAPAGVDGATPTDDAARTAYARSFSAWVGGDVASVSLRATSVYAEEPATAAGAVVGIAAILGGIAYAWPLLKFHGMAALLPLYTRLSRPGILDNEVRSAIYDIIKRNPGISARAIHRESAQSWGTVVYHLRQLERHHVVVSRTLGRTRNYYENHGKYRGMETQLACLQSDRALALARIVVARPSCTQEDLVGASGLPQPTTSYYVRKLKQAGLVHEEREGRYVRYRPSEDLPRYLELARVESAPG